MVGVLEIDSKVPKWTRSIAEGRWCGFGPYYAMFPVSFVRDIVEKLSDIDDAVLDPFCGRGTTPFVSQVMGRYSMGADTNPVAWIFASVKTNPYPIQEDLLERVVELLSDVKGGDQVPENEFQKWAWSSEVLGFLNSARRNLNWLKNRLDRTLMAIILIHLHSKLGEGLSNQMRQSKAMAPDYSVRWWKKRNMYPPDIDIASFFEKKIGWRYKKGLPPRDKKARIYLGDSRRVLKRRQNFSAKLILTSPPYCGITNYSYDNWIRLWMLGSSALPDHSDNTRFTDRIKYERLITDVLATSKIISNSDVTVYLRTSAQKFSSEVAISALTKSWPDHKLAFRFDTAAGPTQTALFGNKWDKKGEIDIIAYTDRKKIPNGFELI